MRGKLMTRIMILEDNKDSLKALQIMIQKISSLIYCIGHSGEVKKVNIYRKLIMESLLDGQKTINEKSP